MKEALFWEKEDGDVRCDLCSHHCLIKEGGRGICNVRVNKGGVLYSLVYGKVASLTPDPIEKKPLYHFYPGTQALSFGTMGCNFRCLHCQNVSLSCGDPESSFLKEMTPKEIVDIAKRYDGIAWTYNEPTISYEYSYDVFKGLKERGGGYTVYVTNGYITQEPLEDISPYLDAMNIDVKAFTDGFYKKVVGARLEPVLETCKRARELDIHIELTYLIIPGYNDSKDEVSDFCRWISDELGKDTVVHFSRFHPHHKMRDVDPTPSSKMYEARDIAHELGLEYVYIGNLPANNDLHCPGCDELILKRGNFTTDKPKLKDGRCPRCGKVIPLRYQRTR